jgi:hypothetical protein
MNRLFLSFVLAVASLGCASIQTVAYTPQPERIADPSREVLAFIKQNIRPGCIAEPRFEGAVLDVKFVCNEGVGHTMARIDRVAAIQIEQFQEWYRVVVKHSNGHEDFSWTSKSLEDVQRAADAFKALTLPADRPRVGETQL